MRTRKIQKIFRFNEHEVACLKTSAERAGLDESTYIRFLIMGYDLREKPDERFYDVMNQMRAIGNNLNQIAHRANYQQYVDVYYYKREYEKWNKFMLEVKEKFLSPVKRKRKLPFE